LWHVCEAFPETLYIGGIKDIFSLAVASDYANQDGLLIMFYGLQ
jgi:hypothetical protein